MPQTTFRDWLMHITTPMRIRACFDFKIMQIYDRVWRWIFQINGSEKVRK